MEFPNGIERASRYHTYIDPAHTTRSAAFRRMIGSSARGLTAVARVFLSGLAQLGRRIDHARQVRAGRRELERMDDHMLADLGIARADIDEVVRNGKSNPASARGRGASPDSHAKAKVVPIHHQADIPGALMLHGPWTRYNLGVKQKNDRAA